MNERLRIWLDGGRTCPEPGERTPDGFLLFDPEQLRAHYTCRNTLRSRWLDRILYWLRPSRIVEDLYDWYWKQTHHRRQRMQRGWSERDAWNANDYLARMTAEMVMHIRDHGMGFQPMTADGEICPYDEGEPGWDPGCDTPERWQAMLTEMAEGFLLAADEDQDPVDFHDPAYAEKMAAREVRIQRAYELYAKWHGGLWD
jgi:hypothetical protein